MLISPLQRCLFYLSCILFKSCLSFKNDGTEILYSHVDKHLLHATNSSSINQARNGGRHPHSTRPWTERTIIKLGAEN
ncbi:unnamed protein product [Staurois parvus]|uniref:Secreted protein n=1 Tax=Staurois parvus TaxID=386267 RepID=A0ABN9EM78_9NEOB|nr:unnamed protein product [Staurois parvus]